MDETAEKLRRLIANYRERLNQGGSFETVSFCLQGIQDAELKLSEIERREKNR